MAGLGNSYIQGFLGSGKRIGEKVYDWTSTFISGISGWFIDKLGRAEFEDLYVRNEFKTGYSIYNRIKFSEDEEILSDGIRIKDLKKNDDNTFTIIPFLRPGDTNPLKSDDLLIGYYHSQEAPSINYTIQKFVVKSDPDTITKSIVLESYNGFIPHKNIILVRIGNVVNKDRQKFIKISRKNSCINLYENISSFSDIDNPGNIKLSIGSSDLPDWAKTLLPEIIKKYGLVGENVLLKGIFILNSGNTVEEEFQLIKNNIDDLGIDSIKENIDSIDQRVYNLENPQGGIGEVTRQEFNELEKRVKDIEIVMNTVFEFDKNTLDFISSGGTAQVTIKTLLGWILH